MLSSSFSNPVGYSGEYMRSCFQNVLGYLGPYHGRDVEPWSANSAFWITDMCLKQTQKTFLNGIWVQEQRPQSENWDLLL